MFKRIIKFLKNYGDSEIRKSFLYGAKGFIAMAVFAWLIWQFSSHYYSEEIKSLRSSLQTIESVYNTLSKKSEGLFEPQLFCTDTLKKKNDRTWAHLNDIFFKIDITHEGKLIFGRGKTGPLRVVLYRNGAYGNIRFEIPLEQPYEYDYREAKYYVIFFALEQEEEVIIAETYKLEPIYKKAPPQHQDDSL